MLSKTTKNRFGYKLDKIFWFFFTLFPLFCYLLFGIKSFGEGSTVPTMVSFFQNTLGFFFSVDNIIMQTFMRIFGTGGIFPLFQSSNIILYCVVYFVNVEVLHVMFDVMVFIPRLAHKWISKAVQDD